MQAEWKAILEGKHHKLKYGYYCVRLPDEDGRSRHISRLESQQLSAYFFDSVSPWKDVIDRSRFGIPSMVQNINRIFVDRIQSSLSGVTPGNHNAGLETNKANREDQKSKAAQQAQGEIEIEQAQKVEQASREMEAQKVEEVKQAQRELDNEQALKVEQERRMEPKKIEEAKQAQLEIDVEQAQKVEQERQQMEAKRAQRELDIEQARKVEQERRMELKKIEEPKRAQLEIDVEQAQKTEKAKRAQREIDIEQAKVEQKRQQMKAQKIEEAKRAQLEIDVEQAKVEQERQQMEAQQEIQIQPAWNVTQPGEIEVQNAQKIEGTEQAQQAPRQIQLKQCMRYFSCCCGSTVSLNSDSDSDSSEFSIQIGMETAQSCVGSCRDHCYVCCGKLGCSRLECIMGRCIVC